MAQPLLDAPQGFAVPHNEGALADVEGLDAEPKPFGEAPYDTELVRTDDSRAKETGRAKCRRESGRLSLTSKEASCIVNARSSRRDNVLCRIGRHMILRVSQKGLFCRDSAFVICRTLP